MRTNYQVLLLSLLLGLSLNAGAQPSLVTEKADTVKIPGGQFEAFWIDTKPRKGVDGKDIPVVRNISILAFESMVAQVTNREYIEFLKKHPEWRRSNVKRIYADQNYLDNFESDLKLKPGINPDAPVTYVSWFAARAYCKSQGMRLPTLEEWEYMALASESNKNAYKDQKFLDRILEWYGRPNEAIALSPTRSIYKNIYGVYDLHGLVWEWVEDFNSSFVTGESRSDTSFNRDLFCGGGSLSGGNKENYAAFMRFGFRSSLKKGSFAIWNLGFRCVR